MTTVDDSLYFDQADLPQPAELVDLARVASELCSVPISLVSIVESDRVRFLASVGTTWEEVSLEHSFCTHTVQQQGLLVVEDAAQDVRFASNPYVSGEGGVRFYAGIPITSPEGLPVFTLCVIDVVPRTLKTTQYEALAQIHGWMVDTLVLEQTPERVH